MGKTFNKDAVILQWFSGLPGNPLPGGASQFEDALPNMRKIRWLNAAGTGYVDGIYVNADNDVVIGTPVAFTGNMTVINDADGDAAITITANAGTAVNGLTVANAATGVDPRLSATGTDANIDFEIMAKGTGGVKILDGNGNEVIVAGAATASAVNEVTVTNAATGNAPSVSATGGDTNIDLQLTAKGTGMVALGTTGTATATAGAATLSAQRGTITSESLTTAAGAIYTLTVTNTKVAATDIVLGAVMNGTNTQGELCLERITPGSGSFVVIIRNRHASQALNGTIKFAFAVL
jgi:hypothetical protein